MRKISALCIAIISGFIFSSCDRTDFFEFAKNGWRTATPVFTPKPGAYLTADGFTGQVEISCDTEGAVIVYTADTSGAEPDDPEYDIETGTLITGTLYTEGAPVSVAVPGTTIIRAMAFTADKGESKIAHGEYVVDQPVGSPYFDPAAGAYSEPIDVEIICDTPGVSIRYTTGEFDSPTETTGIIYTGNPVRISQPTYLRAIAYKDGMMSASTEAYYDVVTTLDTVETPTFTVPAGTYTNSISVEINCATSGSDIYYSFDNVTYDLYSGALTITATTSVYAYAVVTGMNDSATASASYVIDIPVGTVETPTFTVPAGTYASSFAVEINCATSGADIYYSYDNVTYDPYSGPLTISATTTLYAYAAASGMNDSATASASYIIDIPLGTVETPYFSVTGGTHYDPFTVEIFCDTPGAEIYYSYDDVTYELYSIPLNIAGATSLYAYAIASGMDDSSIASTVYSYNTRTVAFDSGGQLNTGETGTLTVMLVLSATSTSTVTVPFTIGGTAAQGSDFTISPSSEVAIPAGNGS
ncbi:MAG TPA: chitobiase/beta-hexosaminidase C-terminal domain-containing protein, partial [Spirochaetota bacterium]|nr:chitobiase/beta-hexosaminidase C-terminal domain-containing protein [Spirochaetota bacterium]